MNLHACQRPPTVGTPIMSNAPGCFAGEVELRTAWSTMLPLKFTDGTPPWSRCRCSSLLAPVDDLADRTHVLVKPQCSNFPAACNMNASKLLWLACWPCLTCCIPHAKEYVSLLVVLQLGSGMVATPGNDGSTMEGQIGDGHLWQLH